MLNLMIVFWKIEIFLSVEYIFLIDLRINLGKYLCKI